jgi:FAD/FMN-containing dehydrogenase
VTVQPGVIRDELNLYLKPHGVFFGPNTSTSSRCMIGGWWGIIPQVLPRFAM